MSITGTATRVRGVCIASVLATLVLSGCAASHRATPLPAFAHAMSPVPGVVVAGRLAPDDIERLRAAGIRSVIDLSADDETPDFDEAGAMRAAGVAYANLPLRGAAGLTRDNVRDFDALVRTAKRPVLVHCASANRVGAMAALRAAWVDGKSVDDAIGIGKAWGLKGLESEVRRRVEPKTGAAPE